VTADDDRWIAAVHEAGHAVAAIKVGYELRQVLLDNAYSCCARLPLSERPRPGIEAWTEDEEKRDGVYTLAGTEAEIELLGAATELAQLPQLAVEFADRERL